MQSQTNEQSYPHLYLLFDQIWKYKKVIDEKERKKKDIQMINDSTIALI